MKASTYIKSSVLLASLLVISACSGKSRDGGGEAAGVPVTMQPAIAAGVGYDNSLGANPQTSIGRDALRSVSLGLADASGTTSNFYSRIVLTFDAQGLLSANANVDIGAFNFNGNQQQQGFDWSQQGQVQGQQVVNFTATNIRYSFNRVSGFLKIENFAMGSSMIAPVSANTQMAQLGGTQQGRMAIGVAGVVYRKSSGRFFNSQSLIPRRSIEGRLMNLADGEMLDANNMAGFNPQTSGFNIYNNVAVTAGQISTVSQQVNVYSPNGAVPAQGTREVFMPTYSPGAYVYIEPVLDPRVQ